MSTAITPPIRFHYQTRFSIKNSKAIKLVVRKIFRAYSINLKRLDFIFCSDEYLLSINQQYLNHNTYTDIITFPLHEVGKPVIGEIYISVDRVRENANTLGVTLKNELHRVIIHGALHLCGYKDKTKMQERAMRELEDYYLSIVSRETRV